MNDDELPLAIPLGFPPNSTLKHLFCKQLIPDSPVVHTEYALILQSLACYYQMQVVPHYVLNGPLRVTDDFFASEFNMLNAAGQFGFTTQQPLFKTFFQDAIPDMRHVQNPVVFVCYALSQVDPERLLALLGSHPPGSTWYADVTNPQMTASTPGVCGSRVEPYYEAGKWKLRHMSLNQLDRVEFNYDVLDALPWHVGETSVVIWETKLVGPRKLLKFMTVDHVPVRTPTPKMTLTKITNPEFSDLLARLPFDSVDKTTSDYQIPYDWAYAWFGDYLYIFKEWSSQTIGDSKFVLPKSLVEYLKIQSVGLARNEKTLDNLLSIGQRMYISSGMKFSSPSLVIMGAAVFAMYVGLPDEVRLVELAASNNSVSQKFSAIKSSIGKPSENTSPLNLKLMAGLSAPLLIYLAWRRFKTLNPLYGALSWTELFKFNFKPILNLAAVIGPLIYWWYRRKGEPPKDDFDNPKFSVVNVCPKMFENKPMETDPSMKLTLNGSNVTNIPQLECIRKTVAVCPTLACLNRLPVFSCQCTAALLTAMKYRMAMKLENPDLDTLTSYKGALCNVLNWSNADLDRNMFVLQNNKFVAELNFYPLDFQEWVSSFPGPKKEMYIRAYQNYIIKGVGNPFSTNCEGFVKFEPVLKADSTFIQEFHSRLIVKFADLYVAWVGPYYKMFGQMMKTKLMPLVTKHTFPEAGVPTAAVPRSYTYASGLTADEVGSWYDYWVDLFTHPHSPTRAPDHQPIRDFFRQCNDDLADYVLVALEADGSRYDGHKHREVKIINNQLFNSMLAPKVRLVHKMLMEAAVDTKITVGSPWGTINFSVDGRHQSGHANTSADNSLNTAGMTEMALSEVQTLCNKTVYASTIVLGDDSACLIYLPRAAIHLLEPAVIKAYSSMCHEAEVLLHHPHQVRKLSFCSGYFYPVLRGGVKCSLWAPKIGRILSRLAWAKDPVADPKAHIRAILVAYRNVFPVLPVLSQYALTTWKLVGDGPIAKLPPEYEHKFTTTITTFEPDFEAWLAFEMAVGYPFGTLSKVTSYIASIDKPTLMDNPSIDALLDVDCPTASVYHKGRVVVNSLLDKQPTIWDNIRKGPINLFEGVKRRVKSYTNDSRNEYVAALVAKLNDFVRYNPFGFNIDTTVGSVASTIVPQKLIELLGNPISVGSWLMNRPLRAMLLCHGLLRDLLSFKLYAFNTLQYSLAPILLATIGPIGLLPLITSYMHPSLPAVLVSPIAEECFRSVDARCRIPVASLLLTMVEIHGVRHLVSTKKALLFWVLYKFMQHMVLFRLPATLKNRIRLHMVFNALAISGAVDWANFVTGLPVYRVVDLRDLMGPHTPLVGAGSTFGAIKDLVTGFVNNFDMFSYLTPLVDPVKQWFKSLLMGDIWSNTALFLTPTLVAALGPAGLMPFLTNSMPGSHETVLVAPLIEEGLRTFDSALSLPVITTTLVLAETVGYYKFISRPTIVKLYIIFIYKLFQHFKVFDYKLPFLQRVRRHMLFNSVITIFLYLNQQINIAAAPSHQSASVGTLWQSNFGAGDVGLLRAIFYICKPSDVLGYVHCPPTLCSFQRKAPNYRRSISKDIKNPIVNMEKQAKKAHLKEKIDPKARKQPRRSKNNSQKQSVAAPVKIMPKSLTKSARQIIQAIALPQVSPGLRLSSGFNDAATAINSLYEREPIEYGVEQETPNFVFRSALRNAIRGVPLTNGQCYSYGGFDTPVLTDGNGTSVLSWTPILPRALSATYGAPEPFVETSTLISPHGPYLYPGRLNDSDQRRGYWMNNGDQMYVITFPGTPLPAQLFVRLMVLKGQEWVLWRPPMQLGVGGGVHFAPMDSAGTSLEGSYVCVEIGTQGSHGSVQTAIFIKGGQADITVNIPRTNTNLNSVSTYCYAHRPLKGIESHFSQIDDIRMYGVSILYTQTSAFTANQGEVAMAQFESHRPWWSTSDYGVVSSVSATRGKYQPVTNGAYAFLKPSSRESFNFLGEFEVDPTGSDSRFTSSSGPSGLVDGAFLFYPTSDYLALILNQDPNVTKSGLITVAATIEYTTEDQWVETAVASLDPAIAAPAIASIRHLPQFHENEFHISDVFNWLKDKAAAVVNGVLEYGPMVLKGAAMAAPFLL